MSWLTGLLKGVLADVLKRQLDNFFSWLSELWAQYQHKRKMKKAKKALNENDNITLEETIGNPDAGEPTYYDGVQRRKANKKGNKSGDMEHKP